MPNRFRPAKIVLGCCFLFLSVPFPPDRVHAAPIEGYPTEASVVKGDTLELHVSSQVSKYTVSIWRQGGILEKVAEIGDFRGMLFPAPSQAWENDCGWPITCRVPIPTTWRAGAYLARFESGTAYAWVPFVVRERVPGSTASMLVQVSTNTYQAYNRYGGKSLYGAFLPGLTGRAYRVTFRRPYNYLATDGSGQFFLWEAPFISWLESEGYAYEVCTNLDLHRHPGLLDAYRVFLSLGHDEYYSKEMYDELERYVNTGGHLAFLSANTLWWQVRFENGEQTMVCYKDRTLDPLFGVDNSRLTINWHYVGRAPARLMGIYYNASAGITAGGYQVVDPHHWVFQGAEVDSGQTFGDPMVGFEVDARTPDSPPQLEVIARTERPDVNDGGIMRPAEMIYYERTPEYGYPEGRGGKVFAGGTVNYVQGLVSYYNPASRTKGRSDPVVRTITMNVLDRLGCSLQVPRLDVPADGQSVAGSRIHLRWSAAATHRAHIPVLYTLFWQRPDARIDSVQTSDLFAWVPIGADSSLYRWWVRADAQCGAVSWSPVWSFWTTTSTDSISGARPSFLTLFRTAGVLTMQISLDAPADGTIEVFDVAGRMVRHFGRRKLEVGTTRIEWHLDDDSGKAIPSGIYFIRATAGPKRSRLKIPIVR